MQTKVVVLKRAFGEAAEQVVDYEEITNVVVTATQKAVTELAKQQQQPPAAGSGGEGTTVVPQAGACGGSGCAPQGGPQMLPGLMAFSGVDPSMYMQTLLAAQQAALGQPGPSVLAGAARPPFGGAPPIPQVTCPFFCFALATELHGSWCG